LRIGERSIIAMSSSSAQKSKNAFKARERLWAVPWLRVFWRWIRKPSTSERVIFSTLVGRWLARSHSRKRSMALE
jgi:hypothetical protein